MAHKTWSDLTVEQKTKGVALLGEEAGFYLRDQNGDIIPETEGVFLKRISEKWLFDTALGQMRSKKSKEAIEAVTDL